MMYAWSPYGEDSTTVFHNRRKRQEDLPWQLVSEYHEYNFSDFYDEDGFDYSQIYDLDGDGRRSHFFYPGDVSDLRKPWVHEPHVIPVVAVYTLTFILGLCGNTLVIFSLLKFHRSRSITTPFLTSLAVADLLFLLVCVPYETTRYFIGHWALGRAFCKVSGFVEMLTAVSSILNLTAVSVERYLMLVHPLKSRPPWTNVLIKKILILVWVLSFGISSPVLYVMSTENNTYYNNQSSVVIVFCADVGIPDDSRLMFALYQLVVMFAAPAIVMAYCYSRVIHALWISTKDLRNLTDKNLGDLTPSSSYSSLLRPFYLRRKQYIFQRGAKTRSMKILEARRQVIKMLCAIVVVFFLSWGPKLIFRTLQRHNLDIMFYPQAFTTKLILDCLPYIQSCINPVIYGFMSRAFRKSVRAACTSTCSLTQDIMCFEKRLMASEFALQQRNLAIKDTYLNEKTNLMTRHTADMKAVK